MTQTITEYIITQYIEELDMARYPEKKPTEADVEISVMRDHGYFLLMKDIDADSAHDVIKWIIEENLVKRGKKKSLTLIIHSEGGDLQAGFAIIDTMQGSAIPIRTIGIGMVAELKEPMEEFVFFNYLKTKMKLTHIRHSALLGKPIKKIAVLGGSGSFAIEAAKASGAQIFITSDLKYHDFFTAENELILADIGHFESEQFTKNILVAFLIKKITNFAVVLSKTHTNPVKYF